MRVSFTKTPHLDYVIRLMHSIRNDGHEIVDFPKVPESDPAFAEHLQNLDICVVWGVAKAKRMKEMGAKNVLIMERAYLGDRAQWLSLGWDDLNGKASFYNKYVAADRWDRYWKNGMLAWKTTGNYVLVCGQVMRDQSLSDCIDYKKWLNDVCEELKNNGESVVFRPHPLEEDDYGIPKHVYISTDKNILSDLKRCKAMVTWSSTTSVLAAYHGVPTCVFSDYSMTNEISSRNIKQLDYMPDRNDWGRKLAYTQWNADELMNGTAWYHVKTRFYY